MSLLFDSIKVRNRQLYDVEAHNRRIAESRRILLGLEDKFDILDFISLPDNLGNGLYKCRITYAHSVQQVEFIPYTPKTIQTLRLINDDTIRYEHKYLDRSCLEKILKTADADDILLVQHGFITDASSANIILYDGKNWMTPKKPLLRGTKRQILLERETIFEIDISMSQLDRFKYAAIINAMLDIGDTPFISMKNILLPIE